MAGLHVHVRAVILAACVGAVAQAMTGCSCSDRTLDDEPRSLGEPACLWLINPRVILADGSTRMILDHENNRSPTVCVCLTEEEYETLGDRLERVGLPEEGTLLDELNDLAYDECKRLAALIDDECLEYYEAGTWLEDIDFARDSWANGTPRGFTCDDR